MPSAVISKAKVLLQTLEAKSIEENKQVKEILTNSSKAPTHQLSIFDESSVQHKELTTQLRKLDLQAMTPIECMLKLKELIDFISK